MSMNLETAIQKIRANGARHFADKGLPTRKDEDWKYTSLKSLTAEALKPVAAGTLAEPLAQRLETICISKFINLVFIDGILAAHKPLPEGLTICEIPLADGLEAFLGKIRKVRKLAAPIRQDSLEALNSANLKSGIFISIPERRKLNRPIQIVSVSTTHGAVHPKIYVSVGKMSQLSLIETNLGGVSESLINSVTEILMEPSAKLSYLRFQDQVPGSNAVGCTRIYLRRQAKLESLSVQTGADLSRHNLDIYCVGKGAEAQVNGLILGSGNQHFDNHTNIDHVVGHCTTKQLYKSILDGEAHSVFNGRVHIRAGAQKAFSDQLNANLLLGSGAEADSKPQLNIYADDVKATHGSTVGQLDAEELFYFLSRGISREKALEMLALGFAQDLLERISDRVIRNWMTDNLRSAYLKMRGSV